MNPTSPTPAQQIAQAIAELERNEQNQFPDQARPNQTQPNQANPGSNRADSQAYSQADHQANHPANQQADYQTNFQSDYPADYQPDDQLDQAAFPGPQNQQDSFTSGSNSNGINSNRSTLSGSNPNSSNPSGINPAYQIPQTQSPQPQSPQNQQTQNQQTQDQQFTYSETPYQPQPDLIDGTQIPKPGGWEGMSLEAQMAYVTEAAMHLTRSRETTAKRQAQSLLSEAPPETRDILNGILQEALAESPHALSQPLSPKAKQALIDLAYGRMMRGRLPSEPSPVAGERPQAMDSDAQRLMKEATANFPELKELDWGRIAGGSR